MNSRSILLALALLSLGTSAFAHELTAMVKKVDPPNHRIGIAILSDSELPAGTEIVIKIDEARKCSARIVNALDTKALLNTEGCAVEDQFHVGQTVSVFDTSVRELAPPPKVVNKPEAPMDKETKEEAAQQFGGPAPEPPAPRSWRVNLSSYYSFANKVKAKGQAETQGNMYDSDFDLETKGAPGLAIGVEAFLRPQISVEGGFGYEFEREVAVLKGSGSNASGYFWFNERFIVTHPRFSIPYFFVNGRYYLTPQLYALAGVNAAFMKAAEGFDADPWFGYQAGLGFNVNRIIGIEAQYRRLGARGSQDVEYQGHAAHFEYDDAALSGALFSLHLSY